jgi:O-acetyl-ADP-ribose deacetylase (regulator of RNase III)
MAQSSEDRLHVIVADLTTLEVDAIVNAANESLLGGGGVDGAIHRAAGPELLVECRGLGGCPTGEARITGGYLLPARFVIHTVGPIWGGGESGEADLLASSYRSSLALAAQASVLSLAFPCISTGVFRFPKSLAARIAVRELEAWIEQSSVPASVLFCCYSEEDAEPYAALGVRRV